MKNWQLAAVFLVLAAVGIFTVDFWLDRQLRRDREIRLTHELSIIRARLEGRLNANLFLVYGMASHLSVVPTITSEQFEDLARVLMNKATLLHNIAAAPDFVIRYVYPLKGNEAVLGLDYRKIPTQWVMALAARQSGQMAVAGPLKLVQGGMGLVARAPVFKEEDGVRTFWGLVSSVMDFDRLIKDLNLDSEHGEMKVAFRGTDGKGEKGSVFYGDPAVFEETSGSVKMPVTLPYGSWQIAAVPAKGWTSGGPVRWPYFLAVLVFAIAGYWVVMIRVEASLNLKESENRLRAMARASHDALIMIDSTDTITFWNPSAQTIFGYSEKEAKGARLHDLIALSEEREKAHKGLKIFEDTGEGPVLNKIAEFMAKDKTGRIFPVERSVAPFQMGGKWYAVGSVRDITRRKNREKRLHELACTDGLTGLNNRRHFIELAQSLLTQAIRYQKPFSMLMFDLDHFKSVNDTHGHDAGDLVLKLVAQIAMAQFRKADVIGRFGGEEFIVAMPETGLEEALNVAERLRVKIMGARLPVKTGTIHFTASIGVAPLSDPDTNLDQMIKKADRALYRAKEKGRNRVEPGEAIEK